MAASPHLLAIVGLKKEAALVGAPDVVTVVGGGDEVGLWARLQAFDTTAFRAVASVGLAGALSPELEVGDWVLADRVFAPDGETLTDPVLRRSLAIALSRTDSRARIHHAPLTADGAMVADAKAKAALHRTTGAVAVDMESHVAARFAKQHGLPFLVARIISDGAGRTLPSAAQAGMRPDGSMNLPAVLYELARDPRQLAPLMRTGREAGVAFRKLGLLGRHDLLGGLGVSDPDLDQLLLDVV